MEGLSAPSKPLDDVREEGLRLARGAQERDLPIRLIGGVAVWVRCPSAQLPSLSRTYGDVDIMTRKSAAHQVTKFFEEMGYVADRFFNAIHGAQRLNFMDPERERPLDVLLDRFSMCHTIDFRRRLDLEPLTVPVTDLLLTKLQVVEINPKDVKDLIALFADHPLSGPPGNVLDLKRLGDVLNADWGFEHTVRINLARVREWVADYELPEGMADSVRQRIDGIVAALDHGRKSLGWRARSVLGERIRWYELPEDVRH